jgi:DNA-binding GntR family transcriptional regulator
LTEVNVGLDPLTQAPVLRDRVYERLEELIITRALAPGERLVETELARLLNVSRNPVREALTLLHHAGWVDIRARRGAHVHEPTAREVADFFLVRTALEVESARLAATKATPASLEGLRALYAQGLSALESGDAQRLTSSNSAFHTKTAEIADNTALSEMLGLLEKRLRWYFGRVARLRGSRSWEEHGALLAAFEQNDPDLAQTVMREHCNGTTAMYTEVAAAEADAPTVYC